MFYNHLEGATVALALDVLQCNCLQLKLKVSKIKSNYFILFFIYQLYEFENQTLSSQILRLINVTLTFTFDATDITSIMKIIVN